MGWDPKDYKMNVRLEIASRIMAGQIAAVYSSKEMLNEFLTDSSLGYKQHVTGFEAFVTNALGYADALIKAEKESRGSKK